MRIATVERDQAEVIYKSVERTLRLQEKFEEAVRKYNVAVQQTERLKNTVEHLEEKLKALIDHLKPEQDEETECVWDFCEGYCHEEGCKRCDR